MQTLNSTPVLRLDKKPADYHSIQLGQLPLTPEEIKTELRLSHALDKSCLSLGEFLKLNPENVSQLSGVGVGYVQRIEKLGAKLPLLGMRHWAAQGYAELKKTLIHETPLPAPTRKALEKVKRHVGVNPDSLISALSLLNLNYTKLANEKKWGEVSVAPLRELSAAISQRLGGLLEFEKESQLPPFFFEGNDLDTASAIDDYLSASIPSFLNGFENQRTKIILEARLGISRKKETLDATASLLVELGESQEKITRERIRQIEKEVKTQFFSSFRLSGQDVIRAGKPFPTSRPAELLSKTASLFHSNELFLDFLAAWSGTSKNDLQLLQPKAILETLFPLFESTFGPYTEATLVESLRTAPQESVESCREKIRLLKEAGFLHQLKSGLWTPTNLPSPVAIAHFYLDTDSGLHWAEAMEYMEETDLLKKPYPNERAFQVRVQIHPLLFLCGIGTYRHRKYHHLPDAAGMHWVRFVKSRLGEQPVNLRYWFHQQKLEGVVDYFEFRDIIKRLGETEGVYFWGQSRRETVALDPNAPSVPNDAVIVDFIGSQDRPLSRKEIRLGLPFIEESTLDLQLSELVIAGRLQKNGPKHWGPTKK